MTTPTTWPSYQTRCITPDGHVFGAYHWENGRPIPSDCPPLASTQAAESQTAAPVARLPITGTSTLSLVLVAVLLIGLGLGLRVLGSQSE